MSKRNIVYFLLLTAALYGCSGNPSTVPPRIDYLPAVKTENDFSTLEGEPLSGKFSNVTSVKVLYALRDKKLYFINGSLYRYHYDFVAAYLKSRQSLYDFNVRNYAADNPDREYLLGNLNRVKATGTYFLELSPSDQMPLSQIDDLYDAVHKNCALGDTLFFYANNPRLLAEATAGELTMPVITSERLFGTVDYQQISPGHVNGILKKYTLADLETTTPGPNEIIVLNGTPLTLPNVKGIIVTELQTPLSHLVLLGRNRNIPIAAYTKAWTDSTINTLLGENVSFESLEDVMHVKETDEAIEEVHKQELVLKRDLKVTGLVALDKIPENGLQYIGAKAYNFSCLAGIAREKKTFKTPEHAFAIPFSYYQNHLNACGAAERVQKLQGIKSPEARKNELKKIRKMITEHPLDRTLLLMVETRLRAQNGFTAFRFRSSTNAEDLGEFNGAGLYDSKSAVLGDPDKTVEKAIKKVWASVWSEGAYNEREIFGIRQATVAMGVLVHRSFPEEEANGVVITENIYRENDGITVNVQKGESSVVLPEKGVGTEIFTAYRYEQPPWNGQITVDYTSHSPLNGYRPLLSEKEIETLYQACMDIHHGMAKHWPREAPCDIEFKLVGKKRELYVKQVRIY